MGSYMQHWLHSRLLSLIAAVLALLLVVSGGLVARWIVQVLDTDPIQVTVNEPSRVSPGESFELRVDVKNIISESHILYSIDIEQQYLEKVEIVSAEPTPDSIGQSGGFVSYNFNTQLKSPSEITIRFKMKALSPTLGFGDLGIFLDDEKGEYRLAIPTTVVASE